MNTSWYVLRGRAGQCLGSPPSPRCGQGTGQGPSRISLLPLGQRWWVTHCSGPSPHPSCWGRASLTLSSSSSTSYLVPGLGRQRCAWTSPSGVLDPGGAGIGCQTVAEQRGHAACHLPAPVTELVPARGKLMPCGIAESTEVTSLGPTPGTYPWHMETKAGVGWQSAPSTSQPAGVFETSLV